MYKNYVIILTHQKIGRSIGFYGCGCYHSESNRRMVNIKQLNEINTYFVLLDESYSKWDDMKELKENQELAKKNMWHVSEKEWIRKTNKKLYELFYPTKLTQLSIGL
jgi:hypothetical protein